jgi:ketosteroid isomerase-like protein
LKGLADAFNAHDATKFASYYTDDAIVTAYGRPMTSGREGISSGLQALFLTFSDVKTGVPRIWVKGNVAIAESVWAGTMTGDFMSIKASKKPAGELQVVVYSFNDDGLVKEARQYADDAGLLAQLKGLKGAPPVPVVPSSPPEVHVAKGTPEEDKLTDWAKSIDDTAAKDDAVAAVALVADDGDIWTNVSAAPASKGKKDVAKAEGAWVKAIPDQKWALANAWGIDGYAIVEHAVSGTQKTAIGTLPTSNKAISGWHWISVMQPNADSKIAHAWSYANAFEAGMQTGALKLPIPVLAKKAPDSPAPSASSAGKTPTNAGPKK